LSEFREISQISEATTAKRMKIGPYCQRQNCSPLNILFSSVYRPIDDVDVGRSPAVSVKQEWAGENKLYTMQAGHK